MSTYFVSHDKIMPIVCRACAVRFDDLEYSILRKSNLLDIMNKTIACRDSDYAKHDLVKLFYYFCLSIKQTQNNMQSNTLLIALLWNQLELIAENYNDERFGSSSEDTLLDVLIIYGGRNIFALISRASYWMDIEFGCGYQKHTAGEIMLVFNFNYV